ncbi:hypothetical protein SADUNF_Sadunf01G0178100 [Salix dunnii]|uniref:TF-B3 domain-containing protein n=1 Tax=Salix dunnii TaxID=1413687 RepID=A0A835TL34_9ROSI|nr:hypothetical protein SADUNF_Sadunf01G0178100 [Salix dunnii]
MSIRWNNNPNPRPVFSGQWIRFVKEKGLRAGDRIVFSRRQTEGDGVRYRIRAERKNIELLDPFHVEKKKRNSARELREKEEK